MLFEMPWLLSSKNLFFVENSQVELLNNSRASCLLEVLCMFGHVCACNKRMSLVCCLNYNKIFNN